MLFRSIAEAVISPLFNGARVFALAKSRLAPSSTLARLEAAAFDFPEAAAIFSKAADAYRIGIYYQTLAGCDRIDAGNLGKFDQRLLKTAFSSIQGFLEFTMSTFVPSV